MSFTLHGLSVSQGVAIGRALTISAASLEVNHQFIQEDQCELEVDRLKKAFSKALEELKKLKDSLPENSPEEMAAFLDVHRFILEDKDLQKKPTELILKRKYNAAWALTTALDELLAEFDEIDDPYLKERGADFRQVIERVLVALQEDTRPTNTDHVDLDRSNSEVIIVAQDIAPHDMMHFKEFNFCGFVTDFGGRNSHTAIVARSLDIPAAVGVKLASQIIKEDEWIIVDGDRGIVIVNPSEIILDEYRHRQAELKLAKDKLEQLKYTQTKTLDGVQINLMANIEMPEDAPEALERGALGIGLFRSEFLFMNRGGKLPNEEEQYIAYSQTIEAMQGLPVNIRTIDIGADKNLGNDENNVTSDISPLGLRGIRWSLSEPEIFLTQLRAILRASAHGKTQIMIPMLAQTHEIDLTLNLVAQAKKQLEERGIAFDPDIKIGAMIELPAAALTMPIFLSRFDFLSIGTNDLIQYTLGIDRTDNAVANLYDPLHPAIIQLIAKIISEANASNISISVCGEMAGDAKLTKLLLAMGLKDFSMHANQILIVKREILKSNTLKLKKLLPKILQTYHPETIKELIEKL
ncbi:phosphoenolpyruvate--protein phosphotransferase [Polynucleobacter rarus]|jgi:phosphotransferase system enzyme I (PtsI)|uniref:phosphoenolpyruvate--protein phosphotransferase n=1 Tax=Polynucleobacter rarus TaxID=556055 RepID=UPI000D3ED10F|nr:phosphoenolpyruvate--protein phosphotransferase [Polynucleobacter rarus]